MKADPTDLTRLLDLQGLDSALEHLKHQAKALPVHQRVAALTEQHGRKADAVIAAKTVLGDAGAAVERVESDVAPVRERLARNQARVDAGQMDAKALSSALEEIAHLNQRVSDLEDAELEALEAVDQAEAQLKTLSEESRQVDAELRDQLAARDREVGALASQAKSLSAERVGLAAQIDPSLVALYEKLRARSNGVGVAKLDGRHCLGCGLQSTVADYDSYLAAPPDEVLRCAECARILVR